jgi:lipoprotein signal peptidase
VHRAPLFVLAGLFVLADVVFDRLVADRAGTLHHPRPLLLMLPALVLIVLLWRVRDQLGHLGRAGVAMCVTGGAANIACTITDREGVSDYIRFQVSHYLIVINAADMLIAVGLAMVVVSTLAAYTHRLRRAAA